MKICGIAADEDDSVRRVAVHAKNGMLSACFPFTEHDPELRSLIKRSMLLPRKYELANGCKFKEEQFLQRVGFWLRSSTSQVGGSVFL